MNTMGVYQYTPKSRFSVGKVLVVIGLVGMLVTSTLGILSVIKVSAFPTVYHETFRKAKWTYIGYIAHDADDISSQADTIVRNLKDIGSSDELNIAVLVDKYGNGNTKAYFIEKNKTLTTIALDTIYESWSDEVNTADYRTLVRWANYVIAKYPAERYYLATSSHSRCGVSIGFDESAPGYHKMNIPVIRKALTEIVSLNCIEAIDVLEFGSCWVGNIAMAYELRNCVKYVIASETTDAVTDLFPAGKELRRNPAMSTRELVKLSVKKLSSGWWTATAYTGLELEKIDDVVVAFKPLSNWLYRNFNDIKDDILAIRKKVQQFDEEHDAPYVDLQHLAELVAQRFRNETVTFFNDVKSAVTNAVVHFEAKSGWGEDMSNAHGIGLMFPKKFGLYIGGDGLYVLSQTQFAHETDWDEFLDRYVATFR